ncbi:MAG TPA: N-acetyl-gamma-glutamyl-phosphate reductase [Caldimonas sp.]|nr:N-acetyl-gamma-glutamyl-phosphate reductase [Caldimonas sp.]HEX2540715.1 N-acetyl-gamma-glutamyl-phosphate reductase [Caldimonas sp.]
MSIRVFVDGQEGTTGLRIHEYLAKRQDIEVLRAAPELRKDTAERARLLNAADVAFLCLPDAAAREAAALVTNPSTCLIDASTAHRTASDWVFGLPELASDQRARLRASKRIANPGCHSTGFILLVRPLVDAGLVSSAALLSATSITGYSGGGKKMIEQYEAGGDARLQSPRPYGLTLSHKHLPEMAVHSRLENRPVFMPIVGNFLKGLSVTVPLHLSELKRGVGGAQLHAALAERYAGEPFVRVMPLSEAPAGGYFDVQACNDTNRAEIFVFASETQALLMARLDNLGKGASGAAVQSMNIHLGVDETTGL